MGTRGPVPNRSNDLSRERDANRAGSIPITRSESFPVTVPKPDPMWHPIAKLMWEGACSSGQSVFYQNSDYALLYSLCEDLSTYKKPHYDKDGVLITKRNGQILATIYGAFERLLITEGDRRRLRIELDEREDEDAEVFDIEDRRRRLGMAS